MVMSGLHLVVGLLSLALIVLGSIWFLRMRLRLNGSSEKSSETNQIINARTKYRSVNGARFSSQIMLFSLALSMGVALICLSWTRYERPVHASTLQEVAELDEIDVVRTMHRPPKPPPKFPRHIETIPEPVPTLKVPPESLETVIEPTIKFSDPDTGAISTWPMIKPPLPKVDEDVPPVFIVVEQMPRFPGCEDVAGSSNDKYQCAQQKLLAYIYDKVRYPALAREAGLEGPVVARFVVEKDGLISNIEIIRDIGGGCGAEVERVVQSMNTMNQSWTPGKQRGVPVRVQFTLPVYFKLR